MNNLKQLLLHLLAALKIRRKNTANGFGVRYAEKFTDPDHCQWNGGRLLTRQELDRLLYSRPTKDE